MKKMKDKLKERKECKGCGKLLKYRRKGRDFCSECVGKGLAFKKQEVKK